MRKIIILALSVCMLCFISSNKVGASGNTWKSKWVLIKCTAYCPCSICCGNNADGKTSTGRDAYKAGVAVDPSVYKLGTHFDIPGYNRGSNGNGSWIRADDTGRLVKGNHIDVRFETHDEAVKWGIKYLRVRVWSK